MVTTAGGLSGPELAAMAEAAASYIEHRTRSGADSPARSAPADRSAMVSSSRAAGVPYRDAAEQALGQLIGVERSAWRRRCAAAEARIADLEALVQRLVEDQER